EVVRQHLVCRRLLEKNKRVAQGLVDGIALDEGVARLRAPPGELLAARSPVAPVPLTDGGGDVAVVMHLLVTLQRQLPAHVGLELEVRPSLFDGGPVQSTPGTAGEA